MDYIQLYHFPIGLSHNMATPNSTRIYPEKFLNSLDLTAPVGTPFSQTGSPTINQGCICTIPEQQCLHVLTNPTLRWRTIYLLTRCQISCFLLRLTLKKLISMRFHYFKTQLENHFHKLNG